MAVWIAHLWERLRMSLWLIPALMSAAAALLAFACADLDLRVDQWPWAHGFLYEGTPQSMRTLLSTVAGSMITVAGVSFSVTMVALSLASSQLGPRLLVNFMADRSNQLVLGGFIATFLFCLLSLGNAPDQGGPTISVATSVGLVLATLSLLLLIYFIHHIASSMQADLVIQSVAEDIDRSLAPLFDPAESGSAPTELGASGSPVVDLCCETKGYVQAVDEARLLKLAQERDLRIKVLRRPGHYVTPGTALVEISPGEALAPAQEQRILRAFIIGGSRTPEQDPEYGIFQLVEIALRALSPGINDPFTAMTCVDHLSGLLASIADVTERPAVRSGTDGTPRLHLDEIRFEGLVEAAFNQIRQSAVGSAAVSIRLLEALARIGEVTRQPRRIEALEHQADQLYDANRERLVALDQQALHGRYRDFRTSLAAEA